MKLIFRKKPVLYAVVIASIVLIVGFLMFGKNSNGDEGTMVVSRGDFIKEVSVSGKVVASENVDLSFSETGKVTNISAKVGDQVTVGQTLAQLNIGTLLSDLQAARANLAQRRAESQNTQVNLNEVRKEQDTLVANAYQKLLSNDLVAVPNSSANTAEIPVITGLYDGSEGRYKVIVRRKAQSSQRDYEISTFDLENNRDVEILDDEATPLGTRGLYISFPDNLDEYNDTIWYVTIPNTKSATYLSVYQDYQEALRTRDREIANAGAELTESNSGLTVSQAEVQSAEAEVSRVLAQISERTITAPFSGIITSVDAKVGGIASANEPALSMISADNLQIESYVPEIHVQFVKLGDEARITLDAYGPEVAFLATVVSLDPAETIRDGVSTYRAKLEFTQKDDRVRSGMTANVVITSEKKENVITIPQGAVTTRNGEKFVFIKKDEKKVEQLVTTGSISSYGEIEIVTGLQDGDVVVVSNSN